MSRRFDVKINSAGKVVSADRPLAPKLAVNHSQTWCIRATNRKALCDGLKALGKIQIGRPNTVRGPMHLWVRQWETKDRSHRPSVLGVGMIPGYGLAKRIANATNRTWAVWINLQGNSSGNPFEGADGPLPGWHHIDSTEAEGKVLGKHVWTFEQLAGTVGRGIDRINDGIFD